MTTVTFSPSSPPRVDQMPLAALLSALLFSLADLLVRSMLRSPSSRIRSFFAKARGENESEKKETSNDEEEAEVREKGAGGDEKQERLRGRRRPRPSLDAVVEDAGIKLVGMLHVVLCLPLASLVLSDERLGTPRSSDGVDVDPRLLLYASTPSSRCLVSLSAGYFLWDVASILVRIYVSSTERGRREGRNVASGFLAHGLVCCSLFGLGALTGRLSYFAGVFLLWEASTPFVYARWALSAAKKGGSGGSGAYTLCGLAMMASFFVARIVFGTRASLQWWRAAGAELRSPLPLPSSAPALEGSNSSIPPIVLCLCLVANVAMNSLNFFWFFKMLAGAAKHFGKGGRKRLETTTTESDAAAASPAAASTSATAAKAASEEDVALGTTAAPDTKLQQRHRVFSVRSTSASEGNGGVVGGGFVSMRGPATPERTREG